MQNKEIIDNIENPVMLEKLYRSDRNEFKTRFLEVLPGLSSFQLAEFWKIRLLDEPDQNENTAGNNDLKPENLSLKFRLLFTVIASLICGTLLKIPAMTGGSFENFIKDNALLILFPALALYYLLKNNADIKKYAVIYSIVIVSDLFMNLAPWSTGSDTRILSSLHFTFLTWILLGAAFVNFDIFSSKARMQFLKRNGDTVILTGVLICTGMLLIMLTVAMFSVIKVRIDKFLENYAVLYGLAAAPIVANYMIESSPRIIDKVAPFISKVFTPIMLLVMTGFLITLIFFAKDPFNNREELIIFNILLVAIIAVVIFTFSGNSGNYRSFYNKILLVLSIEALIINSIALSAIVYRLFTFGVSPNKIAVLGANILLFTNLILITIKLAQFVINKTTSESVEKSMTDIIPYYAYWAVITAVILPVIFLFK